MTFYNLLVSRDKKKIRNDISKKNVSNFILSVVLTSHIYFARVKPNYDGCVLFKRAKISLQWKKHVKRHVVKSKFVQIKFLNKYIIFSLKIINCHTKLNHSTKMCHESFFLLPKIRIFNNCTTCTYQRNIYVCLTS